MPVLEHSDDQKKLVPPNLPSVRPSHQTIFLPKLSEEVMNELFENPIPTIPKIAAKSATWSLLGQTLNAALMLAAEGDWDWLFAVPQLVLWRPKVKFTAGHIARRLRVLQAGNISSLLDEWRNANRKGKTAKVTSTGPCATTRSNERVRAAAMSALCDGYPGVALRRLDPKPILEPAAAMRPLQVLHPSEEEPTLTAQCESSAPEISAELAIRTLKKMPSISAPGVSGLRPSHMRALLGASINASSLADVLNLVANGKGPTWLRNARLIAIAKDNGGLRPIAIGEVIRRLSATALNELFTSHIEQLPRNQLSLLDDGALIGAKMISRALNEGCTIAAIDTSNAFNSLSRKVLIEMVEGTPLESYTKWAYGKHSELFLSNNLSIKSQKGVQQGDPLGMTLFCVSIERAVREVCELNPNIRVLSYADDIYLIGKPLYLEPAANQMSTELSKCGLILNPTKSQLWPRLSPDESANLPLLSTFNQNLKSFSVLGIPIAGDIQANLQRIIREAGASIEHLKDLKHKQGELTILRSAGPYTRVAHLFRAVEPTIWEDSLLEELDGYTVSEVERILGTPLIINKQQQLFLPLSFGGTGLRSAADRRRLQSLYDEGSRSVSLKSSSLQGFDELANAGVIMSDAEPNNSKQIYNSLSVSLTSTEHAFLCQARDPHTGAFLTAKPCGSTELKDEAFCTALRLRLGLDQLPAGYHCSTHETAYDTKGRHALSCQNLQGTVHVRHDLIRDAIYAQCLTLDAASELTLKLVDNNVDLTFQTSDFEHPLMEQRATSTTIPGDIVVQLSRDSPTKTFYDITVVNCLTDRVIEELDKSSDHEFGIERALDVAYRSKLTKHGPDVSAAGGRFVPLVLSTMGVWHGDSLRELRSLSNYVATRRGVTENESWKLLIAELSCALAKGNSRILADARNKFKDGSADDIDTAELGGVWPDRD